MNTIFKKNKGFTLIELLVVILIIGILAGVLVTVIDPKAQQNQARDANTQAAINKMAFGINSFIVTKGRIPSSYDFFYSIGLEGVVEIVTDGCKSAAAKNTAQCVFSLDSTPLAKTCGTGGLNWRSSNPALGSYVSQCYFLYCGDDDTDPTDTTVPNCIYSASEQDYRIYARVWGSPNMYLYRGATSEIYFCRYDATGCTKLTEI